MSKLSRHRTNSGGDLDALLRLSSHNAVMFRFLMHALLCVAALILGFSLSREALLVVVSFRLPHGSLLVKTTVHPHSHEVSIITSFPHVKPSSESESGLSQHGEMRLRNPSHQSTPVADAKVEKQSFSLAESKFTLHHAKRHVPPSELSHTSTGAARVSGSKSTRVHVGRHEILIRPWPHPDPVQTLMAHRLMNVLQEEQIRMYGQNQRKTILVITPTNAGIFQSAQMTCVIHTLRLVPNPLMWIVVEAGKPSSETMDLLSNSKIPYQYVNVGENFAMDTTNVRMEGLRFIRDKQLEGVVVFVDCSTTYSLRFFDEVQTVKWVGAFSVGKLPHTPVQTHGKASPPVGSTELSNVSSMLISIHGSACKAVAQSFGWYVSTRNVSTSLEWSAFAFNSKLLWDDHNKPNWVKPSNELWSGNQTVVYSPFDLLRNSSHAEPLGGCGHLH